MSAASWHRFGKAAFGCKGTCCTEKGLSEHIKSRGRSAAALVANRDLVKLIEIALSGPCHNINSEDRFSRMRTHMVSAHGASCAHTSLAAKHLLAEASAWHREAVRRRYSKTSLVSVAEGICGARGGASTARISCIWI